VGKESKIVTKNFETTEERIQGTKYMTLVDYEKWQLCKWDKQKKKMCTNDLTSIY
jgi:hypothetical protein